MQYLIAELISKEGEAGMKEWVILTDSNCDLPLDYCKKNNIEMLPLSYTIGDTEYLALSKNDLTPKEFYDKLRQGATAKTAMVSVDKFKVAFKERIKNGLSVLYIGFSSALSGTFNSSRLAVEELLDEMDGSCKIIGVDSLAASLGQGLMVDVAVTMKNEGRTLEEVADYLEGAKQDFCHFFTVDDLNHLYRGGRVSKVSAMMGTMLGIKPILHVDEEGKLVPIGKIRGRKNSIDSLAEYIEKNIDKSKSQKVFISHGDCIDDARYLASKIKEKLNINCNMINYVSASIGAHSGPGTVAVFCMGNGRKAK